MISRLEGKERVDTDDNDEIRIIFGSRPLFAWGGGDARYTTRTGFLQGHYMWCYYGLAYMIAYQGFRKFYRETNRIK